MIASRLHRPRAATRELALKTSGGRRRFLISSEILPLFGFSAGRRFDRVPLGASGGFSIIPSPTGVQQVYQRHYSRGRRTETQIEVASESFLANVFPSWNDRVHITMRPERLEIRPLPNESFNIRRAFRESTDPFTAFVALSAGIDSHCLSSLGFRIAGHLEWRPPEARDGDRDLSETGVLTTLANTRPGVVINEDIRRVDWLNVRSLLNEESPIACLHISLLCDCFSRLKSPAARAASIADLTTTRDIFYDALRAVETLRPVTVLVEQVPDFGTSPECEIFTTRLRRWGYSVQAQVFDPTQFGALTTRKRFYLVASLFPGFRFPEPTGKNAIPVMQLVSDLISECRDVSHTRTVHKGLGTRRARHLHPTDLVAPTVFKSQARQTKDALYLAMPDGRFLLPSRRMLKRLCEIPDEFTFDHLGDERAAEQIGQGISYRLHHALLSALKEHLSACYSGSAGLVVSPVPTSNVCTGELPGGQIPLPLC